LQNQVRSNYEKSDVGRWQSFKDFDYILWRVTLPPEHPEAFKSEAEYLLLLVEGLQKKNRRQFTKHGVQEMYIQDFTILFIGLWMIIIFQKRFCQDYQVTYMMLLQKRGCRKTYLK